MEKNIPNFNFTNIDPSVFEWDKDGRYVQTTGKNHGFRDGYRIKIYPVRCDGAALNLGCRILITMGDEVEADFVLDSLGMGIVADAIQGIFIEQFAARSGQSNKA